MTDHNYRPAVKDDDISLKELIEKIREFRIEIFRNWWLLALIAIVALAFQVYQAKKHVPTYNAEVRFIVEGQEGSGGLGGLGGLLGTFGIKKGGKTNPYKILEVAKSKRMIGEILFSKVEDELIANKLIDLYELEEKWTKKKPAFAGFKFVNDTLANLGDLEKAAFIKVYKKVVGNSESKEPAILQTVLDEDTGIFSVSVHAIDEQLSIQMANVVYDKVKFFFEEQVLEDQKQSRDLLKEKADSIEALINVKSIQVARFEDKNRGLISRQAEMQKTKLILEIQGLRNAFEESVKSFEFADYSFRDSKPLFLDIDRPIAPIEPDEESLLINGIKGGIIGFVLGLIFIIIRKIYRDALNEN